MSSYICSISERSISCSTSAGFALKLDSKMLESNTKPSLCSHDFPLYSFLITLFLCWHSLLNAKRKGSGVIICRSARLWIEG